HDGHLQILFGDTTATPEGDPIGAESGGRLEDSFGTIDLRKWNNPQSFSRENMPLVRLGQNPGSVETAAIDPGHAMEGFKTPVGGFSNGTDEYGVFFTFKPEGCRSDADCSNGAQCDLELGYFGPPYSDDAGITWSCIEGSLPQCNASTMSDTDGKPIEPSGFCNDRSSTIWADTPMGRISSVSVKLLIGKRDVATPKKYHTGAVWQTSKFMNPSFRTVQAYEPPGKSPGSFVPDFRPATGGSATAKVFVWGRPQFLGVNATGRTLGAYFAYVDLPSDDSGDAIEWKPQYFAGLDDGGQPVFSPDEKDAVPLDQDSTIAGVQAAEHYDVVDQVSVAWVPQLSRWLMFYGGGMIKRPLEPLLPTCGVLELFTGPECTQVVIGNGAFHMRSSLHPWGPWTPPQDLIEAGDPAVPQSQYGPGGMLRHPECTDPDCAPTTARRDDRKDEYGFFYSTNIIEQWTREAGDGVDIIWNASTWDPYRVILLRTRIEP
ncbi:MAG TPA: hypothetical protein VNQ14_01340, partial [Woeseiaceae bacterium]|nr:hypothetical protein [Woeseiaceae bacterium]